MDIAGEIICTDDRKYQNDPVILAMKASQNLLNQVWTPNLNTIIEEKEFDLKIESEIPIIKQTSHISSKRMKGRMKKDIKLRRHYEKKISDSISKNAIYQATIKIAQNDTVCCVT